METGLVFELEPELAVPVARLPRLQVRQLVIAGDFLGSHDWVLLDTEHQVVFDDDRGAEATPRDDMFVHTDNRVVAREAEFLIRAQKACLMGWDVDNGFNDLALAFFDELAPRGDVRHCFQRVGPLASEQSTGRVLEVECKQKGVLFVEVMGVHIRAQSHCFDEGLAEGASVHLFCEVAPQKVIFTLLVLIFEQLLERLQHNQALSLVSHVRVQFENSLCVAVALGSGASGFLRHLEAIVDAWEIHLVESASLVRANGLSIEKSKLAVVDSDSVCVVVDCLIRGAVHPTGDFVIAELMAVVRLYHSLLNNERVVEVIKLRSQLVFVVKTEFGLHIERGEDVQVRNTAY
mmetsp:Transcript_41740/g.54971  ORF Transcript_41740/g.54971 Transcript_41740/m.54971 type:complete len:348 (-) Transcript_41740:500-1543(-)